MKRILAILSGAAIVLALSLSLSSCAQLDKLESASGLQAGQALVIVGDTWQQLTAARAANARAVTSAKQAADVQPQSAPASAAASKLGWLSALWPF
jgi:phosphoglycolate phosphatase-like HAD superfamily hydrolase